MPVIVHDMPMMSKFVVDFYQQKVTEIKSLQSRLAKTAPGEIRSGSGSGAVRHPGDDRWGIVILSLILISILQGQR